MTTVLHMLRDTLQKISVDELEMVDRTFRVPVTELVPNEESIGGDYRKTIHRHMEVLSKTSYYRVSNNGDTFTVYQPVSIAEYNKGDSFVKVVLNPDFIKAAMGMIESGYTRLDKEVVRVLTSGYSQKIYELLRQAWEQDRRNIRRYEFSLPWLREFLNIKPTSYTAFENFRRRVLEDARAELEEKTPLRFELDFVRYGRGSKVVAVVFADVHFLEPVNPEREVKEDKEAPECERVGFLVSIGVNRANAVEIAQKCTDLTFLQSTYALTKGKRNPAGYFVAIVDSFWAAHLLEQQVLEDQKSAQKAKKEAKEKEESRKRAESVAEAEKTKQYRKEFELLPELVKEQFVQMSTPFRSALVCFIEAKDSGKIVDGCFQEELFSSQE
jgi:hypothetical protein